MTQDAWRTFNETRPPPKPKRWRGLCLRCLVHERARTTQLCERCLEADNPHETDTR